MGLVTSAGLARLESSLGVVAEEAKQTEESRIKMGEKDKATEVARINVGEEAVAEASRVDDELVDGARIKSEVSVPVQTMEEDIKVEEEVTAAAAEAERMKLEEKEALETAERIKAEEEALLATKPERINVGEVLAEEPSVKAKEEEP